MTSKRWITIICVSIAFAFVGETIFASLLHNQITYNQETDSFLSEDTRQIELLNQNDHLDIPEEKLVLSMAKTAEQAVPVMDEMAEAEENIAKDQSSQITLFATNSLEEDYTQTNDTKKEQKEESKEESQVEPYDQFVVNVDSCLNIRKTASVDAEIVGKLYTRSGGTILKRGKVWSKIKSGNITGYVKNEFLYLDEEAKKKEEEYGYYQGVVLTDALRLRSEPDTQSSIVTVLEKNNIFIVEQNDGEWLAINTLDGKEGYVSSSYVSIKHVMEQAISIEEEQKRIAEEAEKERQKKIKASEKENPDVSQESEMSSSYDEQYLLACVVYMESGSESYEGQLAVANVVLNRVRKTGDSIYEVVYAKGQFPGASNGLLATYLKQGPSKSCMKAAKEALSGVNNIGSYRYFISKRKADYSKYTSYTVIGNHVFYQRVW